jgi:hypothetical protein
MLLASIHRQSLKGVGVRLRSIPTEEPNFYSMPYVKPLVSENNHFTNDATSHQLLSNVACMADFTPEHIDVSTEVATTTADDSLPGTLNVASQTLSMPSLAFDEVTRTLPNKGTSDLTNLELRLLFRKTEKYIKETNQSLSLMELMEPRPLPPWPLRLVTEDDNPKAVNKKLAANVYVAQCFSPSFME